MNIHDLLATPATYSPDLDLPADTKDVVCPAMNGRDQVFTQATMAEEQCLERIKAGNVCTDNCPVAKRLETTKRSE